MPPRSAPPPVAALNGVRLQDGAQSLFDGVDLALEPRVRACLVGRNGAGKSTLMRLLAGGIEPDGGERFLQPGLKVANVPQEPAIEGATVLDHAVAGGAERWTAEAELEAFGLDPAKSTHGLSGGEIRRAALARAFAEQPDLLLLDEPTNHLDIAAIETLEARIASLRAAALIVSHDRAFLERTTQRCFWLAHRRVRTLDKGFAAFDAWAERVEAEEAEGLRRLEKAIARETATFYSSITARRTRNEGRAARLDAMRAQKAAVLKDQTRPLDMVLDAGGTSGKLVAEAKGISKSFGVRPSTPFPLDGGRAGDGGVPADIKGKTRKAPPVPAKAGRATTPSPGLSPIEGERRQGETRTLLANFSTRIVRGDRVAIVGPNGAGKTTLVKMLLGQIAPDSGEVRLGTQLDVAYLDQSRAALGGAETLWEALAPDGGDQVVVRGAPRHVAAYAKDFLFRDSQLRQPVSTLSGGERNRLMLARALARPANLLVLDEPTNDLDMETLELLEELIADYDGTLILVSHDRDFIDRLATSTIALDGRGRAVETPGGWTDFVRQNPGFFTSPSQSQPPQSAAPTAPPGEGSRIAPVSSPLQGEVDAQRMEGAPRRPLAKLSYKDARRLEELEALAARLPGEIAAEEGRLADPGLYARDPQGFDRLSAALDARRADLAAAEEEWLALEEKREALAG